MTDQDDEAHRYKIGAMVKLVSGFGYAQNRHAAYEVTALLPSNGVQHQYRIRNSSENFERVAAENELALQNHG